MVFGIVEVGDDGGLNQVGSIGWKEVVFFWIYFENGIDRIAYYSVMDYQKERGIKDVFEVWSLSSRRGRFIQYVEKIMGGSWFERVIWDVEADIIVSLIFRFFLLGVSEVGIFCYFEVRCGYGMSFGQGGSDMCNFGVRVFNYFQFCWFFVEVILGGCVEVKVLLVWVFK